MSHHGNISCVDLNTYDEVTLTNGSQGVKRIDLIVNRYTRNDETGLEKNEWVVIIGTPDASNPKVPQHTIGNLQNGDLIDDCPVFEVHYDGINVTEVKKLLPVMSNLELLNGKLIERETVKTVTLPFTALKNGVCVCTVTPSQSNSYSYIWDGSAVVGAGSCTNGAQYSFPFLVEKGKTYSVKDSSNINKNITKYI